ncbi:lactonase family protein [Clostridium cagae]|uniref:lactonase family protein n=1 Tax=Clostridium TaxID=1485 RepID=UPI00207A3EE0|nr:beta-propeller fold lactonase family protein [Clostridium sp. CH2]
MIVNKDIIIGFIGTHTNNDSKGIYKFSFNSSSGKIDRINLAYEIDDPNYLAIDKERNILYSTCSIEKQSGVSSFKFFGEKDYVDLINYNVEDGKEPCHVSIRKNKQLLISSNYNENEIKVFNTLDGIILTSHVTVNNEDCEKDLNDENSHINCSIFSHDEKYILSVDSGKDVLMLYTFNNDKLVAKKHLSYSFPKNSAPKHITYSKSKPFYYVLAEKSCEIFTLKYNSKKENPFEKVEVTSIFPKDYKGEKLASAIHIHKNNKFLYTSDIRNNTITLFYINDDNGKLEYVDVFDCKGECPRDFQIDPTGKYLICGNELSNTLSIFSIQQSNGALKFMGTEDVPSPTCVKFIE